MKKRGRPSKKLAASRRRQARFVALGLRTDGRPRAPIKPCGCTHGCCLQCRPEGHKGYWTTDELAPMWADYTAGMSMSAIERKYHVSRRGLANAFVRRGYVLRPPPREPKLGYGVKIPAATEVELAAMIAKLKRLAVPDELRREWRTWPLPKRAAFVRRLRKIFPSNRPATPFLGVEPFEYGSPAAHEIMFRLNLGRTSRNKLIALKPCSEGVIWRPESGGPQLFFWDKLNDYISGMGCRKTGPLRPLLKRVIYEHHFGPLPARSIVIQKDGNKNNFTPDNLLVISMADNARRNHWKRLPLDRRRRVWSKTAETRRASTDEKFRRSFAPVMSRLNPTRPLAALIGVKNEF